MDFSQKWRIHRNSTAEMVRGTYTKTVAHDAIVECVTDVITTFFYVIRDPVRNRRMATWNLYVFVTILQRNLHCSIAVVNLHRHSHMILLV